VLQPYKVTIEEALEQDDDELFRRIGGLSRAVESDTDLWLRPADVPLAIERVAMEEGDILGIGKRIANQISKQLHDLLCGEGKDWEKEREQVQAAINKGIDGLASAIGIVLTAIFAAIPAGIIAWLAALIAKMLVKAGIKVVCDIWPEPAFA
jgi:hypothetical protein